MSVVALQRPVPASRVITSAPSAGEVGQVPVAFASQSPVIHTELALGASSVKVIWLQGGGGGPVSGSGPASSGIEVPASPQAPSPSDASGSEQLRKIGRGPPSRW